MGSKGSFLLSLDTELAWGGNHNGSFRERAHLYASTRPVIGRLLSLLEKYEVRATWAIVGHLFLNECHSVGGVKHTELVRPNYSWRRGDWLENDPCTNVERDPFWYAPDIVEAILECAPAQEIACHGFTHVIVGDPGCSRECFESELDACIAAAASWDVTLKSFVFPRNLIGHLDLLAQKGFTSFRGNTSPSWEDRMSPRLQRVARGIRWSTTLPTLTAEPTRESGLWNLPATSFYLHREGLAAWIPVRLRVRRALAGLRAAMAERSTFHLYLHPFNLASDPEPLLHGLETIFRFVAEQRERGHLENPSMCELAGRLTNGKGTSLSVGTS